MEKVIDLAQAAFLLVGIGIYMHWLAYMVGLGWRKATHKIPTNINVNWFTKKK